ncbi:hypothetical protein [Streptomyces meridianus]|uniref:Secreted protein n=1 Tax=Streptomyces meridianus TaxID=2938945 RepID=A0ABT0X9V7_9ACTN|nr:hypothetical protein [Streptomyces meridianus]MCM2578569.1 hypothetical protein [Streptomyces meridianus]
MERLSNPRAPKLRAVALGSAVALAVVLPIAVATANPAGPEPSPLAGTQPAAPAAGPAVAGDATGLLSELNLPEAGDDARTTSVCGPELASPEGVEAQTCVLSGGGGTWGRTYYRNATGRDMDAVVVLMGPDGRNVQVVCSLDAGDEPGVCDTPREPTVRGGAAEPYGAVAEFASADGQRSLLRTGSGAGGGPGV